MLHYLHNAGFINTYEQLRQEAPGMVSVSTSEDVVPCPGVLIYTCFKAEFQPDAAPKTRNVLVIKWNSVRRLLNKVGMECLNPLELYISNSDWL